ncbi:hypothetical protein AKO1_015131 [Acrasis kona]|uniref:Uncharacterized protein n=1 Tax=Acrasis kona TaxID=1008807 RepID=A0AAW2Z025_9EUKA
MFNMNASMHSAVLSSPFALMFGRSPFAVGRDNSEKLFSEEEIKKDQKMMIDFWTTFKNEVVPRIKELNVKRLKDVKYAKKTSQYEIGDIVAYKIPNRGHIKTNIKYVGPFRVKNRDANNVYTIESEVEELLAPADFLKPFDSVDGKLFDKRVKEVELEINNPEEFLDDGRDKNYTPVDPSDKKEEESEEDEKEDEQPVQEERPTQEENIPTGKLRSRANRIKFDPRYC